MQKLSIILIGLLFLIACNGFSEDKSLPMPFHVTMEVTIEDYVMNGEVLDSVILVHQTEFKPQGQQIFLDQKQARAFDDYLPITKGERFLIRESIITDYDESTYATYQVIEKIEKY